MHSTYKSKFGGNAVLQYVFIFLRIADPPQHARQFLHASTTVTNQLWTLIWDIDEGKQPSIAIVFGILQFRSDPMAKVSYKLIFDFHNREMRNFATSLIGGAPKRKQALSKEFVKLF